MEQPREPKYYQEEPKANVIRSKIILEGVEEYRESLELVKADVKELNDSLQSVNNSMEQLTKSVKELSKLFRRA